jgi:hypothetical protein
MTGQDQQISDALREMAAQARTPRLRTDIAWRAGRRRRRTALTAATASVTGAAVAAVAVPLAVAGRPAPSGSHSVPPLATGTAGPGYHVSLGPPEVAQYFPSKSMVALQQVASVSRKSCPNESHSVPGNTPGTCFFVTGPILTAKIESIGVVRERGVHQGGGQPVYTIAVTIAPANPAQFRALTAKLGRIRSAPRNELAWIKGGVVVDNPSTEGQLPDSFWLSVPGSQTKAHLEQVAAVLEG